MTQELLQSEKPDYNEWLKSLKAKVRVSEAEEKEELRWKQRLGKS
jgi:hypothetical protein